MLADSNTFSRTSHSWAKCLWVWDGYWKSKRTQITSYWSNASRIHHRGEEKFAQIHKLINSVQNKEDLSEEWVFLPFYKKSSKTDVVIIVEYYVGQLFMKFYPAALSSFTPNVEEIVVYNCCGFWRNRSAMDHVLCILQIFEKELEYNEAVHQSCIDFKKALINLRWRSCILLPLSLASSLIW